MRYQPPKTHFNYNNRCKTIVCSCFASLKPPTNTSQVCSPIGCQRSPTVAAHNSFHWKFVGERPCARPIQARCASAGRRRHGRRAPLLWCVLVPNFVHKDTRKLFSFSLFMGIECLPRQSMKFPRFGCLINNVPQSAESKILKFWQKYHADVAHCSDYYAVSASLTNSPKQSTIFKMIQFLFCCKYISISWCHVKEIV